MSIADEYLRESQLKILELFRADHIREAKEHFGRAVESGLNVRIYRLTFVAGGSEIDDLDDGAFEAGESNFSARILVRLRTLDILFEEDVLRLEIAMDQMGLV